MPTTPRGVLHAPVTARHAARAGRAFTLIELLLVIVMIGMLAALIWPGLASARWSARATTCAANLRQIGIAYQLYLADTGRLPRPDQAIRGGDLPDRHVLFCPYDTSSPLLGEASSYSMRVMLPPDFGMIDELTS